MTGSVHAAVPQQSKVGRKKKKKKANPNTIDSTRITQAKLAGTKTALATCTSTPGSSTPATGTVTATATPPGQVTPTSFASGNPRQGMNTAQQQPLNALPANSVSTPKRKDNDPPEELSESTASSKRLKATKQENDTTQNDFGARKTAATIPAQTSVMLQSAVGQQMRAAAFSQQSSSPQGNPRSQAVPSEGYTIQRPSLTTFLSVEQSLRDRLLSPNYNTDVRKAVLVSRKGKEVMLCESDDIGVKLELEPGTRKWKQTYFFKESPRAHTEYVRLLRDHEPLELKNYGSQLQLAKATLVFCKRQFRNIILSQNAN